MPYVITTTTPSGWRGTGHPTVFDGVTRTTRRAVATLDEAQDFVRAALDDTAPRNVDESWGINVAAFAGIDKSGGTVGPLPDGTIIAVEQVDFFAIEAATPGWIYGDTAHDNADKDSALIDAFNAAQAG